MWRKPVIPAHEELRHEDHKLEVSLGYKGKPCLKRQTNKNTTVSTAVHLPSVQRDIDLPDY